MTSPIVLFDDQCGKCSRWAAFIERRDPRSSVKLVGQNSQEGKIALESRPSSLDGVDSVFLISSDGTWYSKSSAIWRICRLLRFPWPAASVIFLIPRPIRDSAYDVYSRKRK
ncbi:MAG: thiol-disulfide oxidoreductase [Euryarchaeota archaeon]|nr:thiol-disulfide oxidoreductase [Euryarchaeota archaeon]|tara:strand:- start:2364 stop:2699 length:336 start_codon:yes stop_codon:yes gene_type:complete